MPTIFHKREGRWENTTVSGSCGVLSLAPAGFAPLPDGGEAPPGASLLVRAEGDGQWALFMRDGERLLHNGQRVTAGIRVLAHRDALALEGRDAVYFSTEEAPRIEPFAGGETASCPRCRSELLRGQPTVKCPRCGVFHHEMPDRNCWTYAPTCALCAQPTALDAGLQWTPETL